MASQRNQHFVPKVHLSPFSTDGNGKAISLYNIKNGCVIHNAPIKHQCSGNYFYGDDKVIENLFGEIEGEYAEIGRELAKGEIGGAAVQWLSLFMALQYCRTRQAVEVYREFMQRASAITFRGHSVKEDERPDLSHVATMRGALSQFTAVTPYLRDLAFCVLRNRTKIPLLTSDNPLIHTNRLHLQRLRRDNFGMMSAGAMLILPMAPRLAICLYDSGVYSVDAPGGFAEIKKTCDLLALNELQYLNGEKNVYFSFPDDGARIAAEFAAARHLRPLEKTSFTEFGEVEKGKYRRIDGEIDEADITSKLVMFRTPKPRVVRWPSIFCFRLKPKAYTNGSSAGYVRKQEWLTAEGRPER